MEDTVVETALGSIRGEICEDVRGGRFYSFTGIPYGKPPVGELRFKAPVPAEPWNGIRDGTKMGHQAIQGNVLSGEMVGSEDCLNLNVYTPHVSRDSLNCNKKPVMVFIHGGGFLSGSNGKDMYGPEIIISGGVVLVVINYRLGIFGFLSLEDPSLGVPGNAAFKDMVLALKWVQTNISKFCGDPTNVTIFGNSAGAAAVHFLMLSPMAKGLFHKAICQSGSALSSWAYGMNNGEIMARQMGISYSDEKQILDSLLKASVEELFKAQEAIDKETIKANRFRFIGAVVEDSKTDGELFLTQHPVETLLSGNYNKVPFLVGYNSGDGMIFDSLVPPEENDIYWIDKEYNVPGLLYLKKGSALSKTLGDEIVRYYFGTGKISRETHLKELYNITTDNSFLRGILYSVQNHGGSSATPVYMYKMSLETNLNFYKAILSIELPGVCHADEIGYLFSTFLTETPSPGTVEDTAQRRFVRMWTNFAKFANPTPCRDPLLENVIWTPAVCRDNIPYLDISANLVMRRNPEPDRMKFWKKVYSNGRLVSKL